MIFRPENHDFWVILDMAAGLFIYIVMECFSLRRQGLHAKRMIPQSGPRSQGLEVNKVAQDDSKVTAKDKKEEHQGIFAGRDGSSPAKEVWRGVIVLWAGNCHKQEQQGALRAARAVRVWAWARRSDVARAEFIVRSVYRFYQQKGCRHDGSSVRFLRKAWLLSIVLF